MDALTPEARRSPALVLNERALGLRRSGVATELGRIVVRAGRRTADPDKNATATILLHGAAGSWSTWTPLIVASDRSSKPLADLIVLDLPGWGESGTLSGDASAADVSRAVATVARTLGYSSWRVIGHSLGGFIALDLASREPSTTTGIVLVSGTGVGVLDAIRRPVRGGAKLLAFAGMLATMRVVRLLGAAGRALVRGLHRIGVLATLAAPLFAQPRRIHRSVIDALAVEIRPAAFTRAARIAAAHDTESWRRIECPVWGIRGVQDVFAGAGDAAAFGSLIGRFAELRVPDAGHFAHIERPDAVLAAIALVKRQEAARRGVPATVRGGAETVPAARPLVAA
ncbi:alpha/beta hydrolase [Microbacterium pumilum]|uniref:AB hydrolase-1 domain-containing protein n=1 Tax=Microbacterium pumilum TaxID=344165 RepID=A0ABN2S9V0_9MICO